MRKMPIGAEITKEGVHFRVYASKCRKVEVVLENGETHLLQSEENGYFSGAVKNIGAGTLYQFKLDEKDLVPDPVSRYQPLGPKGPSQVMDPKKFEWTDSSWKGIREKEKVILYELHIGTFTPEGSWLSAIEKLPHLVELGINVIEMMPIAEFPGRFNWGYDGVNLFAPTRNYGKPDDLKRFINEAHKLGLGVILDVVYNHFGPEGNYIHLFSDTFFKKEENEWGRDINFDQEGSEHVREFFLANAGYWIEEFHFDGIRLDACHSIKDAYPSHIILEITQKVREKGGKKETFVIAENERQLVQFILPEKKGGFTLDAIWNEDFHHTCFVRLTGQNEAYYSDYLGKAQEFISSVKHNFLYQGQWYRWQRQRRGTPALNIPPYHFVNFLENHDQVANTGSSFRLHSLSHIRVYRALTALFLLSPQLPLLFQGQEFYSSSPFYYFCDHENELAEKVYQGRLKFVSQFKTLNDPEVKELIPIPHEETTFLRSKLNWQDKETYQKGFALHKDLLELRKKDAVFGHLSEVKIDGAVLNDDAFVLRYFSKHGERLLLINLGIDLFIDPAPEPLFAPPEDHEWVIRWSSDMPQYGGYGYHKIEKRGNWKIIGFSAFILYPEKLKEGSK